MPTSPARLPIRCGGWLLVLSLLPGPAHEADAVESFYRGKQVTMIIAGGVGGGYDTYGRTFARHYGRHIPGNPAVVPKNIPAAGGLQGASTLYNNSDHDGLTVGALTSSSTLDGLFGNPGARYDVLKLNWIGSIGKLQNVCATWHASPVRTMEQLRTREVLVGGSGATSDSAVMPRVLNALIGTKMKVITGYDAGAATELAVERGEIEGVCGLGWSTLKAARPDWIRDHKVNVILQMGIQKHPELPDVAMAQDFVKDPERKKVLELILLRQEFGRPIAAPPGVPAERVQALRKAFEETLADPEFRADAEKALMEIDPLSGAEMAQMLTQAHAQPQTIVRQAAALVEPVQ
jgi:tripartite-type tricarboxylate transporter receptor subunit TctC